MTTKWISTSERVPKKEGRYLVTVATDDGPEVHTLNFRGGKWYHEGEPTFCHSYFFRPGAWKKLPPPADLQSMYGEDDE